MKYIIRPIVSAAALIAGSLAFSNCASGPVAAMNASTVNPRELAADSRAALDTLYRTKPGTRALGAKTKGILVFPEITKGGLMVGAMGGNGALIRSDGTIQDFYQTGGASYGLQAGVQKYGYALFLMDNEAFANINRSGGWEIGSSPTLVVVDEGMSGSISTGTMDKGTYAFFFNQRGLMGGLGLQGSKITRINPPR